MSNVVFTSGDLFESGMQTIVNATNIEGIMGGGIALAFKERFPQMYEEYRWACKEGTHTIMKPFLWRHPHFPWVLNIATKDVIHHPSTPFNVAAGLFWLAQNYEREGITSLAVPALGCGLGGCKWEQIGPLMESMLGLLDIPVLIYEPL